jgi:ribose 1,5-bisphosphokinase
VVCNVSRTVVAQVRERFDRVIVVLVTAPDDVLASRLAARARASDGPVRKRLARTAVIAEPDVVIENVGTPRTAAEALLRLIGEP